MTRFFLEEVTGDGVQLCKEDSHHLLRVMRARPGERFTVLAGAVEYECLLVGAEEGQAFGRVVASRPAAGEASVRITLFQGLAKGDKVESIIEHGTEIGIAEFVPVATERSVVRLEPKRAAERVQRWQRIAREAAEQSRRGALPPVAPVATWQEAVARCPEFDLAIVAWEEGKEPLRAVLEQAAPVRRVALFIGPEGGLSAGEAALARQYGAHVVTLGPRILRTETAGLVAAATLLYAWGDLGA